MLWTRLRHLAALAALAPIAIVTAPPVPATAVGPGDPVLYEDFSGTLAGWVGTGAAAGAWSSVYDPASPSPEKTVFANDDGQATEHAAHWLAAELGTSFELSVTAQSVPTEAETWVGVALRHDPGTGRYVAVRFEVGGERVEVRRYPGGELLAATTRTSALGGEGCTWFVQPFYPTGEYFHIRALQDASGLLWVYDDEDPLLNVPLSEDERDGGYAGVFYSGGPSRFEDLRIQGPDLETPWSAEIQVNAGVDVTRIEDEVFGAMVLWHAAANGIDPNAATLDDRRDNLARLQETFPMMASMGIKTLRFPGGLLSNDYRWKDHIGNFYEGTGISELTLDDFLLMAESLGARPVITVNASDPPFGLGTIDGAREAADWVEYLTVPDDGSNPDPDGLGPDDPDNVDWAHLRALNGHREPYDVAGFEVGNELRGPPYLNSIYPASAYAERFVEFASAMKAVNPEILVGAVGKDSPLSSTYEPWYEDVSSRIEAADCDRLPGDGVAVRCGDFWVKHIFVPNYTSASAPLDESIGLLFDQPDASLVRGFEVPATGTYRIWTAATVFGGTGPMPQVRLEVDGGNVLDQTLEIANNAPLQHAAWRDMGLYPSEPVVLDAGVHQVRLTRANSGLFNNRSLIVHPILALVEDVPDDPSITPIDLRDSERVAQILHAAATEYAPRVLAPGATAPGELYGMPLWVTELSPSYEGINGNAGVAEADYFEAPMDPTLGDLREMLLEANMYMLLVASGVTDLTNLQLFDDILRGGLIEGVGIDSHHGDEMGLTRIGSNRPPRLRPRGLLLREMARHWRGRTVATSVASPTYATGGDEVALGKLGLTEMNAVPYVRALATLDDADNVLALTLTNTHLTEAIRANVALTGFAPGAPIETTVLTGADPGANNEPEADVCSNPGLDPAEDCAPGVEPATSTLAPTGSDLSVLLPPNSVTFVRVPAAGGDHEAPAAPFALSAETSAAAGGVALAWQWSGAESVTFNVYRSVHWETSDRSNEDDTDTVEAPCLGPWGHRLNDTPLSAAAFADAKIDPARVYCYGVEAVDAAGNRSDVVAVRHRGTVGWNLAPDSFTLSDGAQVQYGTALANVAVDLAPPDGQPTNDDFLVIRPKLTSLIPPAGKEAELVIRTTPFEGVPEDLVSLRLLVSLRFRTPLFVSVAEISLRNFTAGGTWEPAQTITLSSNFRKSTRHALRLNPADYLSAEGRVEVKISTLGGDPYTELFLEHVRVDLESL